VLYEFIFYATKFSYNQSLISLHLWNSKHVKREPEILAMLSSICVSRCLSLQNHSEDWYVALIHNYALERWFRVSFYWSACSSQGSEHVLLIHQVHLGTGATLWSRLGCILSQDWMLSKLPSWPKSTISTCHLMGSYIYPCPSKILSN